MDRRFSAKDGVYVVLLLGVIGIIAMAMWQYDRQWAVLKQLQSQSAEQGADLAEQSRQLRAIQATLRTGVAMAGNGTTTSPTTMSTGGGTFASAKGDPFAAQAEAMNDPKYAQGDWLIQNFGTKVAKLTPLLSSDVYARIVQNRVVEPLGYRDPETFAWTPLLATDWTVSPDGLSIDVKLRHNVQFSDGAPLTADDFVFAIDFIRNPAIAAPRERSGYEPLDRLEKVNDYEIRFVFKRPYFEALAVVMDTVPLHKAFYSHYTAQQFNESVGLLIGTGPYRLPDPTAWTPGTPIQLVRNERYWGEPAPFDRLYWREVEEDAASLAMFRNGEVDTFGASPEQWDALKNDPAITAKANPFTYYARDGGYSYIGWNESRGGKPTVFADKRVRQAMTMLIDRERIIRDVYRGHGRVAAGPYGIVSKQNDPAIRPWPYDLDRATRLLADAGFNQKNAQGILTDGGGRELRFKLAYGSKDPNTEKIVLQIKDSLARVGVVLEQEPATFPIIIKKLNDRDFDAITLGWTGGIETDIFQMFHSSNIADGGDDFCSYKNADLDAVIERARKTVDEGERMKYWQQAHAILHEDQPYTFLFFRESLQFVDKRIANVKQTRSGLNYLSTDAMPVPWFVPAAKQVHKE